MLQRILGFTVATVLAAGGGISAQQDTWTVLTYPDPAPGVLRTWCMDINQRGDMVGYRVGPTNQAFLLSAGQYYDIHAALQPAGATVSIAMGINSRGDIVGDYWAGTQEHGMLLRKGELITIDLPGHVMTHPRGINDGGDIVGFYMTTWTPPSPWQAFLLYKDGTLVEAQYPGSTRSALYGINERGDAVGEYDDASGSRHGYLLTREGEFVQLDYPGAITTIAYRINASGEVVGYYSDGVWHGFRWYRGVFVQDDYPGAVHTMNHGLNDRGDTCGMVSNSTGLPIVWGGFAHIRAGR